MKHGNAFGGTLRLALVSPDVDGTLAYIINAGITIFGVEAVSELETHFTADRQDYQQLRMLCKKYNSTLSVIGREGVYWSINMLVFRPVLLGLLVLLIGLTVFLPSRVLFFEVEGLQKVSKGEILEVLDRCGVGFGTVRKDVRSEKIKNALLEELPQLQWAGINTFGCRAVISVRERDTPHETSVPSGVHNVIAVCDGVVEEVVVTRGSPVCKPGQSVREGEVLISGYSDLGICIRGECAQGIVFATTKRHVQAFSPFFEKFDSSNEKERKNYFFFFGKKRINFFKGSGISHTSCDKIYAEKYMTLPGGYQLPLGVGVEWEIPHFDEDITITEDDFHSILTRQAENYLLSQTISGEILNRIESFSESDGGIFLTGDYACREMIGRLRIEEQLRVP